MAGDEDLSALLSDAEVDELEEFLLSDATGDHGCLDASELHGFFTAVVSGPLIRPSEWQKAVFGTADPVFESLEEAEKIYSYVLRVQNEIAGWLYEDPESFEPWFNERRMVHPTITIVDEWCQGYARAMRLRASDWRKFRRNAVNKDLMTPILAFAYFNREPYRTMLKDPRMEARLSGAVRDCAIAIYARWRDNAPEG